MLPIISQDNDYERIYWDNIWELDEQYISSEDISKWEEQYNMGKYKLVQFFPENLKEYLFQEQINEYFSEEDYEL